MKTTLTSAQSLGLANSDDASASFVGNLFGKVRASFADRALRRQLADLDDALLRDIGVADDEIWRVRAQHSFTPRAWN